MIRCPGLRTQMAGAATERSADGLTPSEQLAAIRRDLLPTLDQATALWSGDLSTSLARPACAFCRTRSSRRSKASCCGGTFANRSFRADSARVRPGASVSAHLQPLDQPRRRGARHEPGGEVSPAPCAGHLPRLVRIPDEEKADNYAGLQNIAEPELRLAGGSDRGQPRSALSGDGGRRVLPVPGDARCDAEIEKTSGGSVDRGL
jgi:hypothetical protein